jgi:hypothetical protein
VSAPATSAGPSASAPTAHLSILSPRPAAHTGSTLTVRVGVSGAPSTGAPVFRYVLDRRLTRSGSSRLTFHDLAAGRHHLVVSLAADSPIHAATTFTVRAPPAVVVAPTQPTTTPAPEPAVTNPPPSTGGIPQGNGGDGDGDNNGRPSDGDGNI